MVVEVLEVPMLGLLDGYWPEN